MGNPPSTDSASKHQNPKAEPSAVIEGVPLDLSYQWSTVSLSQILDTPLPAQA